GDEPGGVAGDKTAEDEPAAKEQERGAGGFGARRAAARPQARDEDEQRGRQEPRDLAAHQRVEEPRGTGRAAEAAARPALRPTVDPAEAVVAPDQVEDAVARRTADVGTVGR